MNLFKFSILISKMTKITFGHIVNTKDVIDYDKYTFRYIEKAINVRRTMYSECYKVENESPILPEIVQHCLTESLIMKYDARRLLHHIILS